MANETALKRKAVRTKPFFSRSSFIAVATLLTLTTSIESWAACSPRGGEVIHVNTGSLVVPPKTAVGEQVFEQALTANFNSVTCDPADVLTLALGRFRTLSSLGNDIYDTNIPGIGMKISHRTKADEEYIFPSQHSLSYLEGGDDFIFKLYKTSSTVGVGKIESTTIGNYAFTAMQVLTVNFGIGDIVSPGCDVDTSTVNVPLGKFRAGHFSGGIGGTTSSTAFTIGLTCNSTLDVSLKLEGIAASGSPPGTIALTSSTETATGVGVQILHKDTPVELGKLMKVGTSTGAGHFAIPLSARYYQTDSTITAGEANAIASFTLTYN